MFSFGKFTKSGPTDEQVANSSTEHYLVAKGNCFIISSFHKYMNILELIPNFELL